MSTKVLVEESSLEAIASAIRAKNSSQTTYKPSEMAEAIGDISGYPEPTGSITISQNGDANVKSYANAHVVVPNSYAQGDEGKVVSNGALVAQTARSESITQNGTYDTTLNNSIVVDVSGGSGGGDVVLMTRSAWNLLTTAQKQACGLVAIQDAMSGYKRGDLVNGADYVELNRYLPASDDAKIICSAYPSIYDASALEWGDGDASVIFSKLGASQNADGSVHIPVKSNGVLAYVDLGTVDRPFTVYFVAKVASANSNYTRELGIMASRGTGNGLLLYGSSNINVSSWASDTPTGVNPTNYFVGVLQYASSGNAKGSVISASSATPSFISKAPSTVGRYIAIGRTDIDPSAQNAEPSDMDVLFLGVTTDVESESVIASNMQYLAQQFIEGGNA